MIRFFIEKLRATPGPLKQPRVIVGDLAEELLDLAQHYVKRWRGRDEDGPQEPYGVADVPQGPEPTRGFAEDDRAAATGDEPTSAPAHDDASDATTPKRSSPKAASRPAKAPKERERAPKKKKKSAKKPAPSRPKLERKLEVREELAAALDNDRNQKKQEFKVLAIAFDAGERGLGFMSAKEISDHGEKLGLEIRHENVRKVIRMRLEDYVDIQVEQLGNGKVYRYRISDKGREYVSSNYLSQ